MSKRREIFSELKRDGIRGKCLIPQIFHGNSRYARLILKSWPRLLLRLGWIATTGMLPLKEQKKVKAILLRVIVIQRGALRGKP